MLLFTNTVILSFLKRERESTLNDHANGHEITVNVPSRSSSQIVFMALLC
jgi:hypothetical protein